MIVVILGMHRSGTSALAGLLHSNGIVMGRKGEFFPPPQIQNPKGFYENRLFRELNDNLLRIRNYNVKQFDPFVPEVNSCDDYKPIMEELIKSYQREFENWGFKDPRTCLTFTAWLEVFEELGLIEQMRIVIMTRKFTDIAESMRVRNNKENYKHQFIDLCHSYYIRAINSTAEMVERVKIINFKYLMEDKERICHQLSLFLNYPLPDTSFIEPKISGMSPQNRKRILRNRFGLRADGKPRQELLN